MTKLKKSTVAASASVEVEVEVFECSICIEPIHGINNLTRPHCGHTFHSECLLRFVLSNAPNRNACPNCRATLIESFEPSLPSHLSFSSLPIINNDISENGVIMFNNASLKLAFTMWSRRQIYAEQLYGHISNWNVSRVTDMRCIFRNATSFNQPIGNWDVSNVTTMRGMFINANSFNQPLDNWDVSNVDDMCFMFNEATSFNQPLDNWDVSNVTNMHVMYNDATEFNQPIDNWDVSNVIDMGFMFDNATSFNRTIYNWAVSSDTNVMGMFTGLPHLPDLSHY
jgi:surface protein